MFSLLSLAFGAEWEALAFADRARVALDYGEARAEGCDSREYAQRIGRGNLASYAACLAVGERRRASAPLAALRHHVTGAIERGEAAAIVEKGRSDG
jgi:hypothetical protein